MITDDKKSILERVNFFCAFFIWSDPASSTLPATNWPHTSALERRTMSAEKVQIQDHLDTSVIASLEDQHLIWMSVVTSLPLLCHASETFGQAWVVMSMRMRLSTSHIFLVAVTVRLFVKTTKDVNSSVMRWMCEDCLIRPGAKCGCFCGPKFPDLDDCSEEPAFGLGKFWQNILLLNKKACQILPVFGPLHHLPKQTKTVPASMPFQIFDYKYCIGLSWKIMDYASVQNLKSKNKNLK